MASTVHDFTTGEVLTAALVESWLQPLGAMKTADETVNNSATLQNDNHLVVSLEANALYAMTLFLIVNSNNVADIKFDFTGPASFGYRGVCTNVFLTTTSDIREVTEAAVVAPPTDGVGYLHVVGHVVTAGNAGTLQFRWAQNTANASNTIVATNSYLTLQRVS